MYILYPLTTIKFEISIFSFFRTLGLLIRSLRHYISLVGLSLYFIDHNILNSTKLISKVTRGEILCNIYVVLLGTTYEEFRIQSF